MDEVQLHGEIAPSRWEMVQAMERIEYRFQAIRSMPHDVQGSVFCLPH